MTYRLTKERFTYWNRLLERMAEADANSGVPLRADHKQRLARLNSEFKPLVDKYISLRGQDRQTRKEAAALQKHGRQLLQKTKHALLNKAPKHEAAALLESYRLNHRLPTARLDVLGRLRLAHAAIAQQTNPEQVLQEHLQNNLKSVYDALNQKIETCNSLHADLAATQRALRNAMLACAELREQVYSYLIGELPGGTNDPKLIDYGMRSTFRRPGTPRTAAVVDAQEGTREPVITAQSATPASSNRAEPLLASPPSPA